MFSILKNYDLSIQRNSPPISNRLHYPGLLLDLSAHLHEAHQQLDLQSHGVSQLSAQNEKFLLHQNRLFK
ncbi:Golgin Subfamily A Member 4 [Manis pentadactyla]|nr:Golgin Subfamily A Member 4 [Manis pentadactyla]